MYPLSSWAVRWFPSPRTFHNSRLIVIGGATCQPPPFEVRGLEESLPSAALRFRDLEYSNVGSGSRLPKESLVFASFDMWVGRCICTYLLSLARFNGHWAGVVLVISLRGPGSVGLVWCLLGGESLSVFGPLLCSGLGPGCVIWVVTR